MGLDSIQAEGGLGVGLSENPVLERQGEEMGDGREEGQGKAGGR